MKELHPLQIEAWRRMTPDEKWALTRQANRLIRESVRNRIRRQSPGLSEETINREASRFLLRSRT